MGMEVGPREEERSAKPRRETVPVRESTRTWDLVLTGLNFFIVAGEECKCACARVCWLCFLGGSSISLLVTRFEATSVFWDENTYASSMRGIARWWDSRRVEKGRRKTSSRVAGCDRMGCG